MKKRIISLLMTAVMVVSVITVTVFAEIETKYSVWINGIQVTKSNMTDVLGDADGNAKTVAFNPDTNTLTLNNATIAETGASTGFGYGNFTYGVKSELDVLNVNLIGTNRIGKQINSESAWEDYSVDIGISCKGDVVFSGNADSKLTVYDYCAGIMAKNVTFGENFKGKLTVRDSGGPEPQPPCAINAVGIFDDDSGDYLSDGNVSISGGTFDLISFESNGIAVGGSVTVKNAKLTVDASYSAIETRGGDVTLKNSDISLSGDAAIDCESGNILIEKVNLKAASDGREGICSRKDITITDCEKVDVYGADEALCASEKVSIINCPDVKLESDWLNTIGADDILINNSTLNITANHGYSGLSAVVNEDDSGNGSVTVKDSKLNIRAEGNGINCNSLDVIGAKTEIYSVGDTEADGKGCGAVINGSEAKISITDGTVKLTGGEAGIKLQMKGEENPFVGSLPNVSFEGNTAFDTFVPVQNVTYKSEKNQGNGTFVEYPYIGDEIAKSVIVSHTHKLVKVQGVAATTKNSGCKSFYKCDCGKFFEDSEGKTQIADIDKWKAKGGRGYLPELAEQKETKQEDKKQKENEQIEAEQGETEEKSPKTGDCADISLWVLLLAVSFTGLVSCTIFGIKKRTEN